MLPERADLFEKLKVGPSVRRAAVITPVSVVKMPKGSGSFCRHVNQVQG